jgi:hypothetical protein
MHPIVSGHAFENACHLNAPQVTLFKMAALSMHFLRQVTPFKVPTS